jgi:pyruvate kinase
MWGVIPYLANAADLADANALSKRLARQIGLASDGEFILMVRGFHADPQKNAPSITLLQV